MLLTAASLASALVLGLVFAVAGGAKLLDRRGSREALRQFGVPGRLTGAMALALPLAEIAIAILILPASTRVVAAVAALALLLAFSGAIAVAVARGRTPDCHCFGQLHSRPAGWRALARNGVLVALAGLVIEGDGGPSAVAWLGDLGGLEWVGVALAASLVVVSAGGAWAIAHALRAYGRLLVRFERLEHVLGEAGFLLDADEPLPEIGRAPGMPAPTFALRRLEGGTARLDELLEAGSPVLLLFTSPTCGPCRTLMPRVARWQREHAAEITVALVASGDPSALRAEVVEHGVENVLLDEDMKTYEAYRANGTPSAVLVAADGTIASWVASGADWIERLVGQVLERGSQAGVPVGEPAPALELPDLEGRTFALRALRGEKTVILFWNPGCGFCRAMHADLLDWERSRNGVSPRLVVVSSGSAEEAAAERFASTVLVDESFTAGTAFGAGGTPMAVLLDAEGRVVSSVVAGTLDVLDLLGARTPAADLP